MIQLVHQAESTGDSAGAGASGDELTRGMMAVPTGDMCNCPGTLVVASVVVVRRLSVAIALLHYAVVVVLVDSIVAVSRVEIDSTLSTGDGAGIDCAAGLRLAARQASLFAYSDAG